MDCSLLCCALAFATGCIVGAFSSKPLGVLDHFTAGCGDPYGTLAGEGYAVAFYVARDGAVEQYHATNVWGWHARQASSVYYGIEHEGYPTRCDLTEAQLEASAALNAWLFGEVLAYTPEQLARSKGQRFTIGVKSHNDGLEDANNWDDAHHWDGIWKADADWLDARTRAALNRSPWTSATYISKVKAYMRGGGEDDVALTEDQVATLGG
jgi:N-acetylmuramoyl-L-alanine amidase-like protein